MIIITGQTATGKTALALKYAKKYNGELINFDSRQVYKYLDIITGKDLPKNLEFRIQNLESKNKKYQIGFYQLPSNHQPPTTNHQPLTTNLWLYDIVKPNKYFSSFEYVKLAQNVINYIISRGKTPILVGGSYFYLKHLLYGFDYSVPPDFKLREELNKKSVQELQKILTNLQDLQGQALLGPGLQRPGLFMNQSDWNNPRRLIRKIEILNYKKRNSKTGVEEERLSDCAEAIFPACRWSPSTDGKKSDTGPVFLYLGLRYKNKEDLLQAIKTRVEKRLKQGAVEEVKKILSMGYKKTDPGLQTIGCKQIIEYLEGKTDLQTAIENWITAEAQYAKRQYTFMKKDENIKWIEI